MSDSVLSDIQKQIIVTSVMAYSKVNIITKDSIKTVCGIILYSKKISISSWSWMLEQIIAKYQSILQY